MVKIAWKEAVMKESSVNYPLMIGGVEQRVNIRFTYQERWIWGVHEVDVYEYFILDEDGYDLPEDDEIYNKITSDDDKKNYRWLEKLVA